MNRFALVFSSVLLVGAFGPSNAQEGSQEPTDSGVQEEVKVTLVQVDALVTDNDGRTIPDLTKDDFELRLGNQVLEVATLDVVCPIGAAADPLPLKVGARVQPIGPGVKRRLVFAFDYYFLASTMRPQILEAAESMLRFAKTEDEEVMIVALGYGVRVEQRFTSDLNQLIMALRRMEHDVTLWAFQFGIGATGEGYFKDLMTLMDVVGGYDGSKAVVLFSQLRSINATVKDTWYNDVAMHAAAARAAIYPANPDLLVSGGVSEALARFANQSGGRMGFNTADVSVPYRWAQRDLSCRYTVGGYLDTEQGRKRKPVHVSVKRPGAKLRFPEMIRLFTDEEKQRSRARAAFADPSPYENPLIRTFAFPANPANAKAWDTLIALHFSMPVEEAGVDLNVQAVIRQNGTQVDKYKNSFRIEPPRDGGKSRPVTIFGDTKLKDGMHDLTVVLTKPGGADVVSAETQFTVPQILKDLLILRGPILARVVPGGMLIRADPKDKPNDTRLDEILGSDNTFEPLLIHEIDPSDELLSYWNACVVGQLQLDGEALVSRKFVTEEGELAHELDAIPLVLKSQGKKVSCHTALEQLPSNTLEPGQYEYEVTITSSGGDRIAHATVPLHVH